MLSNIAVTADMGIGDSVVALTVVTFPWSGGVGASGAASAPTGAPRVSLTATTKGSFVFGAGNDWDADIERIPADGQALVYQLLPPSDDTFWVQMSVEPVAAAGTIVELSDTEPTTDQWNFAAVEILPLRAPTLTWAEPSAITYGTLDPS